MKQPQPLKEIVSVTEMSRMCRLSRAMFYQLTSQGIFPPPSRNQKTGRPFFNREQQEQCLQVRRTNRGANGKAVMFYGCRPAVPPPPPRRRKNSRNRKPPARQDRQDPVIGDLRHGLSQLGMTNVADQDLRKTLSEAYPDGHRDVESAELLRVVFGMLQGRNSQDNVSG